MISTPTVFVLGAGASVPYGLSTGNELRFKLAHVGGLYNSKLVECGFAQDEIERFRRTFESHDDESIDQFMSNLDPSRPEHQSLIAIGKHAISVCILGAEGGPEQLAAPEAHDSIPNLPSASPQKWYSRLLNDVLSNSQEGDLETLRDAPVSFITFNYDRSLEQYFLDKIRARCQTHGIPDSDIVARQAVAAMRVHHVYGKAGDLPSDMHEEDGVPYGKCQPNHVASAAKGIRVIPKDRPSLLAGAKQGALADAITWIEAAKRLVIIGFGFDDMNCRLLDLDRFLADHRKTKWITTCGLRQRALERIDRGRHAVFNGIKNDRTLPKGSESEQMKKIVVAEAWKARELFDRRDFCG